MDAVRRPATKYESADRKRRGEMRASPPSIRKSTAYTRRVQATRAQGRENFGLGRQLRGTGGVPRGRSDETGAHLDRISRRGEDSLVGSKSETHAAHAK